MITPFHRTPSGLSNLAVFLGVDVVVYLEGGERHYTLTDLENETSASENYDTMFWQAVFRVFRPRLKAHFKSIGSKTTVLSVSRLVAAGNVRNVVTALDRDLDHVRRAKLRHPNILYTYGYSWENDVFTRVNLKTLTGRMCMNQARCRDLDREIDGAFGRFSRAFNVFVDWEYSLARSGAAACDRGALINTIELRTPNPPEISRNKIATMLRTSRISNQNVKLRKRRDVDVCRDIHGHTLERLCLGLLQHLFASLLGLRMTNDACTRMLIGLFERTLRGRGAVSQYYRKSATFPAV
jgi:hypothetical protein